MTDDSGRPESEHSQQQVMESILEAVSSLKESIQVINDKLGDLETASLSCIAEKLEILTKLVIDTNEHLDSTHSKSGTMIREMQDSMKQRDENITRNLTELKKPIEEYHIRLKDELEDATGRMVEASSQLEITLCDAMKAVEIVLGNVSREGSESIIETINELSGNMEVLSMQIGTGITDAAKETATILSEAFGEVENRSNRQIEQLSEISELLTLHREQLQDNELKDLNRRAISYFNNGDFREAESLLSEALDMSPESPEILSNMAHVEAALDNPEGAERIFRKVLEIEPEFDTALSGLGTILIQTDRAEETVEFLKGVFESDRHRSPDLMLVLARALTSVDRHKDAVSLLEKAKELAPGHPGIESALQEYGDGI